MHIGQNLIIFAVAAVALLAAVSYVVLSQTTGLGGYETKGPNSQMQMTYTCPTLPTAKSDPQVTKCFTYPDKPQSYAIFDKVTGNFVSCGVKTSRLSATQFYCPVPAYVCTNLPAAEKTTASRVCSPMRRAYAYFSRTGLFLTDGQGCHEDYHEMPSSFSFFLCAITKIFNSCNILDATEKSNAFSACRAQRKRFASFSESAGRFNTCHDTAYTAAGFVSCELPPLTCDQIKPIENNKPATENGFSICFKQEKSFASFNKFTGAFNTCHDTAYSADLFLSCEVTAHTCETLAVNQFSDAGFTTCAAADKAYASFNKFTGAFNLCHDTAYSAPKFISCPIPVFSNCTTTRALHNQAMVRCGNENHVYGIFNAYTDALISCQDTPSTSAVRVSCKVPETYSCGRLSSEGKLDARFKDCTQANALYACFGWTTGSFVACGSAPSNFLCCPAPFNYPTLESISAAEKEKGYAQCSKESNRYPLFNKYAGLFAGSCYDGILGVRFPLFASRINTCDTLTSAQKSAGYQKCVYLTRDSPQYYVPLFDEYSGSAVSCTDSSGLTSGRVIPGAFGCTMPLPFDSCDKVSASEKTFGFNACSKAGYVYTRFYKYDSRYWGCSMSDQSSIGMTWLYCPTQTATPTPSATPTPTPVPGEVV